MSAFAEGLLHRPSTRGEVGGRWLWLCPPSGSLRLGSPGVTSRTQAEVTGRQGQDGSGGTAEGDQGGGVGLEVADPRRLRLSAQERTPMASDPRYRSSRDRVEAGRGL